MWSLLSQRVQLLVIVGITVLLVLAVEGFGAWYGGGLVRRRTGQPAQVPFAFRVAYRRPSRRSCKLCLASVMATLPGARATNLSKSQRHLGRSAHHDLEGSHDEEQPFADRRHDHHQTDPIFDVGTPSHS
jgi:hypothetical protein